MFGNLKWILGAAFTAMLFGGGYSVGARKVDALEAQIETIKREGDTAEARLKNSQAEIVKELKDKEAAYARQTEAQKAEADRNSKELAAALAGANTRIAQLRAEVSTISARRAKLVAEMAAASEAEKKKLQDQIEVLDRDTKVLVAKVDANECLALAVPAPVLKPLMVHQ
jgi:chromosome segregation ATPase